MPRLGQKVKSRACAAFAFIYQEIRVQGGKSHPTQAFSFKTGFIQ